VCTNQSCFNQTGCTASNCPQGCCDGTICVQPAQFSTSLCGQGAGGASCVPCSNGQVCTSGQCIFPATDAGGFGDAGFPDLCSALSTPCTSSQCCDFDSVFGFIPTCYSVGQLCGVSGTTCSANNICQ
jgi:hypothetical protein